MTALGDFTTVYIDNNEPPGMDDLFLELEYNTERRDLKPLAFDYIQGNVGIERKRVDDFLKSVQGSKTSKHSIYDQLNRMVYTDRHAYLIIEGDLFRYLTESNMTTDNFYGAMGGIAVRYNIPPMWAHDDINFVYLAGKIFKSHREGKHGIGRANKVTYVNSDYPVAAQIISIVDGMDKLSLEIAKQLGLNDIDDVASLTVSELTSVSGIGETKAQHIINYLWNRRK